MLAHELVAEIFGVEGLEFVGHGRALHEEYPTSHLQGVGDTREGLFHKFKSAADDTIHRDCHAATSHLVAKDVYTL